MKNSKICENCPKICENFVPFTVSEKPSINTNNKKRKFFAFAFFLFYVFAVLTSYCQFSLLFFCIKKEEKSYNISENKMGVPHHNHSKDKVDY